MFLSLNTPAIHQNPLLYIWHMRWMLRLPFKAPHSHHRLSHLSIINTPVVMPLWPPPNHQALHYATNIPFQAPQPYPLISQRRSQTCAIKTFDLATYPPSPHPDPSRVPHNMKGSGAVTAIQATLAKRQATSRSPTRDSINLTRDPARNAHFMDSDGCKAGRNEPRMDSFV